MPPRPESSPCRDMKPENIINLFDAAAAPNISVTSPTQADTPTAASAAPTPTATAVEEIPAVATVATNGASEAVEMPPGFLFKVTTMHDYAANDSDELEMKAGDIVLVVAFDNPEEQVSTSPCHLIFTHLLDPKNPKRSVRCKQYEENSTNAYVDLDPFRSASIKVLESQHQGIRTTALRC
ncbi:unnamed protein product [Oncorhynchus mykiss]|uniref:SH3 domain-containing protein n=1 Tax=Oncorhynchus mykiss TaxID=8022 RepID=A0A060YT66_ONCMY|nr:unnamed protein product [Oncorhynchus mykiss]